MTVEKRFGLAAWLRPGILIPCIILINLACLPFMNNGDIRLFLKPWYAYIVEHGRWASLGDAFHNYTPPYIYLLSVGTLADGLLSPGVIIKIVAIFCSLLLAWAFHYFIRYFLERDQARIATLALLLVPTVWINGAWWGQCDALHTAATIAALGLILRERWWAGMAMLGLAFSIKFPPAFLAPLMLGLLLSRRLPPVTLIAPPLVYALMMLPAWIAGRTAWDLATIYMMQAGYYQDLSAAAPNMWEYIDASRTLGGTPWISYSAGATIGFAFGIAATLALAIITLRCRPTRERLVLMALSGAVILPYVMAKMHNRYWFIADILSFALAIIAPSRRRTWIAICVQMGSMLASLRFLIKIPAGAAIGGVFMTVALVLIVRELLDMDRESRRRA